MSAHGKKINEFLQVSQGGDRKIPWKCLLRFTDLLDSDANIFQNFNAL